MPVPLPALAALQVVQTCLYTSSGAQCNCSAFSCQNNDPNDCINCDTSCLNSCTRNLSTQCFDVQAICSPYYYSKLVGICDTTILAIEDCDTQTSSTVWTLCNTGYNLSPSQDGCCLPDYYFNSGSCDTCYIDCNTCTGAFITDCLTCKDNNALPVLGKCQCNSGYKENSTNPLVCICNDGYYSDSRASNGCGTCNNNCVTCNGGTSSDCLTSINDASTASPGTCYCDDGFYQSSSSPIVCTV